MATTLMVDYIFSLDGYGAGEGWPGFWASTVPSTSPGWARTHRTDSFI